MRDSFLTVTVVKRWSRLPREAVKPPLLDVFKSRLDQWC